MAWSSARNANAGIADAHENAAIGVGAREDGDRAVFRRELHRIGQQVEQDLLDRRAHRHRIAPGRGSIVVLQGTCVVSGPPRHQLQGVRAMACRLSSASSSCQRPASILARSRMSLISARQVLAGGMDQAGIFDGTLRVLGKDAAGDDFGKAQYRVQRRAQLMAHIGQELRLGAGWRLPPARGRGRIPAWPSPARPSACRAPGPA